MSQIDFTQNSKGFHHTSTARKHYVPKDLENCEHVFVRLDRIRKALEAPYQGPFPVLERTAKVFKILLPNGKTENISIDRLKPAYIFKNHAQTVTFHLTNSVLDPKQVTNAITREEKGSAETANIKTNNKTRPKKHVHFSRKLVTSLSAPPLKGGLM